MRHHQVYVGAGVSGTAALIATVRGLERLPPPLTRRLAERLAITIVERSGDFGPGLPYGRATAGFHLLNMKAGAMSLVHDAPDDFVAWLADRAPIDEALPRPPRAAIAGRHRYGDYTRQRFGEYRDRARRLGVRVEEVSESAVSLVRGRRPGRAERKAHAPDRLGVVLAGGRVLWADAVLVATGHADPADTDHCRSHGAARSADGGGLYFPWPADALARAVPAGATVGLLGSSLTAVDACLTIAYALGDFRRVVPWRYEYRPRRPYTVVMCSRRGLLPGVQVEAPAGVADGNPHLRPDAEPGDGATTSAVRRRFEASVEWALRAADLPCTLPAPATGVGDCTEAAHRQLRRGIAEWRAQDPAAATVQATAQAFFVPLWSLYRGMPSRERSTVWREFMTPFLVHAAAMPVENAARIEALLAAGVLRLRAGVGAVEPRGSGFRLTFAAPAEPLDVRWLVNAIGRGRGNGADDPFVRSGIAAGLLVDDPQGGVAVDPDTSLALDPTGAIDRRIAALGPLTMGSHIGASAAASSVKRANVLAAEWLHDAAIAVGLPADPLGTVAAPSPYRGHGRPQLVPAVS